MIVEYDLTIKDLSDFHIFCARHLPVQRLSHRIVKGFLLFLGLLCGLASWRYFQFAIDNYTPQRLAIGSWNFLWEWTRSFLLFILSSTFIFLVWRYKYSMAYNIRESLQKKAHLPAIQRQLGHHYVEIGTEGYFVRSQTSEMRQQWNAVNQFYASDTACYLFNTSVTAYILPRRAVEPGIEWSIFCQMLRESIDQAISAQTGEASKSGE